MNDQTRKPAPAPQPGPAHVSAAPARPMEPGKPSAATVTHDRPHDDHIDEPAVPLRGDVDPMGGRLVKVRDERLRHVVIGPGVDRVMELP